MSKTTRTNGSRDGRKVVIASLPRRSRAFLKAVEFSSTFSEPQKARMKALNLDLKIQIEDMEP